MADSRKSLNPNDSVLTMNNDFEFLWYFDDEEELEFWKWCLHNRELLELLQHKEIDYEEVMEAQTTMLTSGKRPDVSLAVHCIDLGACTFRAERSEQAMYQIIVDAFGGKVLGGPGQPDCLVNGIPVEAKKDCFSKSSLSQLERYMSRYKSKYGMAAAPKLKIKLPECVFFLCVTFSQESRRYKIENLNEALLWFQDLRKRKEGDK